MTNRKKLFFNEVRRNTRGVFITVAIVFVVLFILAKV